MLDKNAVRRRVFLPCSLEIRFSHRLILANEGTDKPGTLDRRALASPRAPRSGRIVKMARLFGQDAPSNFQVVRSLIYLNARR